jgi:pimeloyl-ACP methyl ester carboxylesterase
VPGRQATPARREIVRSGPPLVSAIGLRLYGSPGTSEGPICVWLPGRAGNFDAVLLGRREDPRAVLSAAGLTVYAVDCRTAFVDPHVPWQRAMVGTWDLGTFIDDVDWVVDMTRRRHPRRPIVLIGHSTGARLAYLCAARAPRTRVSGLISLDGGPRHRQCVQLESCADDPRWLEDRYGRDLERRGQEHAHAGVKAFAAAYGAKCPKAAAKITEDEEELLAFYDYPAEHWVHLRTTNPIESTFATVRLRTKVTKGHGSKAAALAMAFKLIESAQRRWRMVNAPHLVALVRAGATFINGKLVERPEDEVAGAAQPEAA